MSHTKLPTRAFEFMVGEMKECHRLLTQVGVPEEWDGERLSLSQRLHVFIQHISQGAEEDGDEEEAPFDTPH